MGVGGLQDSPAGTAISFKGNGLFSFVARSKSKGNIDRFGFAYAQAFGRAEAASRRDLTRG